MTLTSIPNADISRMSSEMKRMTEEGMGSFNVRKLAENAIAGHEDKILAIYDYLKRWPYIPDPVGKELLISPNRQAEDFLTKGEIHGGDCDDLAMLSAAVLGSIGYKVRIVIASYRFDREFEHAYTEVWVEDSWFNFDLSSSRPLGWITPTTKEIHIEF